MADKYGVVNEWETKNTFISYRCSCWKAILHSLPDFKKRTRMEVGSRIRTTFWKDRWCSNRPLMLEHLTLYRLVRDYDVKVVEYWNPKGDSGFWNVDLCCSLNDWEVEELASLLGKVDPFCLRPGVEDYQYWLYANNEIFSVKSFREAQWVGETTPGHLWADI